MSLADELTKLQKLREAGALTEPEFEDAKRALLREEAASSPPPVSQGSLGLLDGQDQSLGRAANRYVNLQVVSSVIGAIVFLIVACAMLSMFNDAKESSPFGGNNCYPGTSC